VQFAIIADYYKAHAELSYKLQATSYTTLQHEILHILKSIRLVQSYKPLIIPDQRDQFTLLQSQLNYLLLRTTFYTMVDLLKKINSSQFTGYVCSDLSVPYLTTLSEARLLRMIK
jgi:hypothetical protein